MIDNLNKVILHNSFFEMINEIKNANLSFYKIGTQTEFNFSFDTFPPNGYLRILETDIKTLNIENGQNLIKDSNMVYCGYDESTWDYSALEGSAFFTSHSLIVCTNNDYFPVCTLTNHFFTRSKTLSKKSKLLQVSDDPRSSAKKCYALDRDNFLTNYIPDNSIVFIDGPLIGGQMSEMTIRTVKRIHEKNSIPIFFVKNSDSNLVTDYSPELKGQYNSDMHWSSKILKSGQRTNLFVYEDQVSKNKSKIFFYLKTYADVSPQRVEFHIDTYKIYKNSLDDIIDMVIYLILANGDKRNPQIRPISIAEKFARSTLNLIDYRSLIRKSALIPIMNQERGFRG